MSHERTQRSTPEQFSANYESLHDVPSDVLASRIVGQLILCKGDLVKYAAVLEGFLNRWRSGVAATVETPTLTRWDADFTKEPYMKVSPNGEWVRFVDVAGETLQPASEATEEWNEG